MAHKTGKTEHSGAKKGAGSYWGRKKDAKDESNRQRREVDKSAGRGSHKDLSQHDAEIMAKKEDLGVISQLEGAIRLNPSDDEGNRYLLLQRYFLIDERKAARKLLDMYPDDPVADWSYAILLDMIISRREIADILVQAGKALAANGWIPSYLRGEMKIPKKLPDELGLGSKEEAMVYASNWASIWDSTGALELLFDLETELLSGENELPEGFEEVLSRCAWCEIPMSPENEVFGLGARVRGDFDLGPHRGGILPVLRKGKNPLKCIVATEDSDAASAGQDLQFMICSLGCADQLREFLKKEIEFVDRVFP